MQREHQLASLQGQKIERCREPRQDVVQSLRVTTSLSRVLGRSDIAGQLAPFVLVPFKGKGDETYLWYRRNTSIL